MGVSLAAAIRPRGWFQRDWLLEVSLHSTSVLSPLAQGPLQASPPSATLCLSHRAPRFPPEGANSRSCLHCVCIVARSQSASQVLFSRACLNLLSRLDSQTPGRTWHGLCAEADVGCSTRRLRATESSIMTLGMRGRPLPTSPSPHIGGATAASRCCYVLGLQWCSLFPHHFAPNCLCG